MHRLIGFAALAACGLCLACVDAARGADAPEPSFYEAFDSGKVAGAVGSAGTGFKREARDIVDMDRGTLAFFIKSDKAIAPSNWNRMAGLNAPRSGSYWNMLMDFNGKFNDFMFNVYDVGRYSPPLKMASPIGRWKPGQWVHLAVVWDRRQGVTVYEDGKRAASNWGVYRWNWSLTPSELFVNLPVDELYVFNDVLTDAQVAQLAKGEKPTGPVAAEKAGEDESERTRMGWTQAGLSGLARVKADEAVALVFARISKAVAAKRPVAPPRGGIMASSWPDIKYGASTRARELDLELAPGTSFDRVRMFVQRPFEGELLRSKAEGGPSETLTTIQAPEAMWWTRKLDKPVAGEAGQSLKITRKTGSLGPVDFYRVEPVAGTALPKTRLTYRFEKAEALPKDETGLTLTAQTPARYRRPVLGKESGVADWSLNTPAYGGFQAMMAAPSGPARALDGVVVKLVAQGITGPTPVRVAVTEPVNGVRTWLSAEVVLEPKGPGRQTYTVVLRGRPVINMPEHKRRKYLGNGKYEATPSDVPGVPLGMSVTAGAPVTWAMGDSGCTLGLVETDMKGVIGVAADDQVEFMREGYAEEMEGHRYGDPSIVIPLRWLCMFAPERMETRQMLERADSPRLFEGMNVAPLVYEKAANTTGAPDWAFWQMKAMEEHRKVLDFYIDEKQVETGEFGGIWNDDTDHTEQWIGLALCMDDSGKIKKALHRFWDGLWTLQLEEGVGKYVQDSCHFYEEGMGSMGMRLLLDYGDPTAYARALATCGHYGKWLREDGSGGLGNISEFMSLNENWTEGERFANSGGRRGHNRDMIVPAAYLIWYNRHPEMARIYRGWFNGVEPGVGDGLQSYAYDAVSDPEKAKENYLKRLRETKPEKLSDVMTYTELMDAVGVDDTTRKILAQPYKPAAAVQHYPSYLSTEMHWYQYKTSGDIRYLTESYQQVCGWFHSHDWLNSRAEPTMDRNPLPRTTLERARTGGLASNRGASRVMWPSYGLSYTKGGDNVAALVMDNRETRLSARFYLFGDKAQELGLKVWRLDPGTYEVVLSKDANDDGKPEGVIARQKLELDRGAAVTLTLPPREPVMVEILPIRTSKPNYDQADAAIGPETVELIYDDHLVVRVYNNGTKPVENLLVRVRDLKSGQVIGRGEQRIARIPAPLDMKPQHRSVEFLNITPNAMGGVIVEVDPENEAQDLNRHNNVVEVRF